MGLRSVSGFFVLLPRFLGLDSELLRAVWFRLRTPMGVEDFMFSKPRPFWPWGLLSLLYNGYQDCPGDKAAEARRWPPTPLLAPKLQNWSSHASAPILWRHGILRGTITIYYYYYMTKHFNGNRRLLNGLLLVTSVFDLFFQFFIFNVWISVCTKFHHLCFGRPLSRPPWGLLLNTWLTFLLISILLTRPIQFNRRIPTEENISKSPHSCMYS
jgi:hypothetical protein